MILTGCETAEGRRRAGVPVDLGEELTCGSQVCGPSEPSSVAGVDVHMNIKCRQFLDSIDNALFIRRLGTGTLGQAEVGDQVGQ